MSNQPPTKPTKDPNITGEGGGFGPKDGKEKAAAHMDDVRKKAIKPPK